VLGRTVAGPTYVETKRALDPARSESRGPTHVWRDIERAAAASPVPAPPLPGEIVVGFKSRWQAEVAGGERVGTHAVRVGGASFGEAYRAALAATRRSDAHLGPALRSHSAAAAIDDATGMLLRPFPGDRSPSCRLESELALEFFLGATAGGRAWERADRALILHMLEGHAPRLFAELRLGPALDDAMRALVSLPGGFPLELHPVEAMARADALYLAAERGAPRTFDADGLSRYLRRTVAAEPVFAWLIDEMAAQQGRARTLALPERALRAVSRTHDLYWLTHLYLLATRYLRRPLPQRGWETRTEELCLATPFITSGPLTDLGAEVALCLQLAGEAETGEHGRLLALLRDHQQPDGRVADPSTQGKADGDEADRLRAHTTGAALLAFAGTIRE
jgi:D-amino peptidase